MKKVVIILIVIMTLKMTAQSFSEMNNSNFVGVNYPSITIANINTDDNTPEILITGGNDSGYIANFYTQDVNGDYFDATEVGGFIDGVNSRAAVAYADIDNDGDQDLLITSQNTKLYINDGFGDFTETSTTIANVIQGAIAFFDADNDSDLDVIVTGYDANTEPAAVLYLNDGTGVFTEVQNTPFEGVANSTISYADIDNDGSLDLFITGSNWSFDKTARLFVNNGNAVFTEVLGTPFEGFTNGVAQGSTAFADIDGDGDQDLFITGRNWQNQPVGKLYTNNGTGVFSEVNNTGLPPVQESAIAFADVDSDNDLDLMITGLSNGPTISKLYTNNGSGSFTEVANLPFDEILRSAISFFDVDSDNDLDLIIAGFSVNESTFKTTLYENTTVLGIVDFNYLEKVNVYPNPVTTTFTIQIPENLSVTSSSLQVVLYDSFGRKVKETSHFSFKNNTVNIQHLKSGLYFYELINANQKIASGKLIKN